MERAAGVGAAGLFFEAVSTVAAPTVGGADGATDVTTAFFAFVVHGRL